MTDLLATSSCLLLDASSSSCSYSFGFGTSSPLFSELRIGIILLIAMVSLLTLDFVRRLFASRL